MTTSREFDRPLEFNYDTQPSVLLPILGIDAYIPAVRAIAAAAVIEAGHGGEEGGWLHYSRRRNWYARHRRYLHQPDHTCAYVLEAVDIMERANLIEPWKAERGASLGRQSRLRASRRLLSLVHTADIVEQRYEKECIILKQRGIPERKGQPKIRSASIPYVDTPETNRMRMNLRTINSGLAGVKLEHPKLGVIKPGSSTRLELSNGRFADGGPAKMWMERKFTDTFEFHGRFYGWWQNWPKSERLRLTIDGEAVIELDYAQLHPTLLYAEKGITLPPPTMRIQSPRRRMAA